MDEIIPKKKKKKAIGRIHSYMCSTESVHCGRVYSIWRQFGLWLLNLMSAVIVQQIHFQRRETFSGFFIAKFQFVTKQAGIN